MGEGVGGGSSGGCRGNGAGSKGGRAVCPPSLGEDSGMANKTTDGKRRPGSVAFVVLAPKLPWPLLVT